MWKRICVMTLVLFPWQPVRIDAQARVPDVKVDVAVHRRVDGTQEQGFHLVQLSCSSGNCTLATVSFDGPWSCGLGVLVPTIEVASTRSGQLLVSSSETGSGTELVVRDLTWASDLGGESSPAIYRFQVIPAGEYTLLTGFSGGFTRASSVLRRVMNIELVPVASGRQSVPCPLQLRGIGK